MWQVAAILASRVSDPSQSDLSQPFQPSSAPFHKLTAAAKLERISYILNLIVFPSSRTWCVLSISGL